MFVSGGAQLLFAAKTDASSKLFMKSKDVRRKMEAFTADLMLDFFYMELFCNLSHQAWRTREDDIGIDTWK